MVMVSRLGGGVVEIRLALKKSFTVSFTSKYYLLSKATSFPNERSDPVPTEISAFRGL